MVRDQSSQLGSARVSRAGFGVHAETIFAKHSAPDLQRTHRKSPRWRGRHRQHAGRVRYPRARPLSDRDDVVGLTRYVHSRKVRLMNLRRITPRPRVRDQVTVRIPDRCSQRCRSATLPDNGNHQNRFLFADNSGTVPASIPFHGIG